MGSEEKTCWPANPIQVARPALPSTGNQANTWRQRVAGNKVSGLTEVTVAGS